MEYTSEEQAESLGARTAKMASYLLLGKFASFIMLALSFVIVARVLGPADYGLYTLALAIVGIFSAFGSFGVDSAANKFVSEYVTKGERERIGPLVSNSLYIVLTAGIVLTIIAFVAGGPVAALAMHSTSYGYLVEIASLIVLLTMVFNVSYSALVGYGKGRRVGVSLIAQAAFQAGISVWLVLAGFGALGPIIGLIAGMAAGSAVSIYYIYAGGTVHLSTPNRREMARILHFSLPIAGSNVIASMVSSLTLVVLGLLATSVIVGNFGVASKMGSMVDIVAGSISLSLISAFSSAASLKGGAARVSAFYNSAVHYAMIFLVPMLLFIAVLAKPFSYVAFSSRYAIAPTYMLIMAIGILVSIVGSYASMMFISSERTKRLFMYNTIVSVLQLLSMPFLIYYSGGIGAALVLYIVGPILADALYLYGIRKHLGVRISFGKTYRVVLAGLVSAALIVPLLLVISNYMVLLAAAFVEQLLIYPIILVSLGGARREDLRGIRRITHGVPAVGYAVEVISSYAEMFVR